MMTEKALETAHVKAGETITLLQTASVGSPTIFSSAVNRDWFETLLIRAQYKLRAAEYHYENVKDHEKRIHDEASQKAEQLRADSNKISRARQTFTAHVPPIAHELDSFLAVTRAAIDHLANCMGRHIQGMKSVTSVSTLLDLDLKNPGTPFGAHLQKWESWINYLRDYRDQHVHYRVLYGKHGYEIVREGANVSFAVVPFLVPDTLAKDEPWTKLRILDLLNDNDPEGVTRMETTTELEIDGKKTRSVRLDFRASTGYLTGEQFCEKHLRSLADFFSETMTIIKGNDFKLMKRPHGT